MHTVNVDIFAKVNICAFSLCRQFRGIIFSRICVIYLSYSILFFLSRHIFAQAQDCPKICTARTFLRSRYSNSLICIHRLIFFKFHNVYLNLTDVNRV